VFGAYRLAACSEHDLQPARPSRRGRGSICRRWPAGPDGVHSGAHRVGWGGAGRCTRRQIVRDVPVGGPVQVVWARRRWFCAELACPRGTFAEATVQVPTRARPATRLRDALGGAVIDSCWSARRPARACRFVAVGAVRAERGCGPVVSGRPAAGPPLRHRRAPRPDGALVAWRRCGGDSSRG